MNIEITSIFNKEYPYKFHMRKTNIDDLRYNEANA